MTEQKVVTERREAHRSPYHASVLLQVETGETFQSVPAETLDINRFGVSVEIGGKNNIPTSGTPQDFLIQLNGQSLAARLVWHSESRCGFRFAKEFQRIEGLMPSVGSELEKYFLYVGGKDIDTGEYGFFPYADKFVSSPRETLHRVAELRQGKVPVDLQYYFSARYTVGDAKLSEMAVAAAHKAFLQFRDFSFDARYRMLEEVREVLLQEKEKLFTLMAIEGHPRKLAEWEFDGMVTGLRKKTLDFYKSEILKTAGQDGNETLMLVRRPDGVFCVCPPRNASCSNSLTAILALLVGNTLVVKPPLACPVSTIYLWRNIIAKVLEKHGAPPGTVNIIVGNSKEFMDGWLENPLVRGVLFFHDSDMGIEMGKQLYEKGKKPILELSGNDYMVIWKDAHIEKAADSLIEGFLGSTQICMVPKKAVVHADIYDEFVKVFLEKVRKLKVGLPSDPETILSPVLKMNEFFDFLQDGLDNGAKLLAGGQRIDFHGEKSPRGAYLQPSILEVDSRIAGNLKCVREENFFPLIPLIKVDGAGENLRERDRVIFDQMRQLLEQNEYGLRISAWVRDPFYLRKMVADFHSSGILRINSRHVGFSAYISTHGGIGRSGGPFGEMNYIWQKSSHLQGISITHPDDLK